ncbi:GntR family transcriptional regulator [Corynebacterium otitidis]|mgnify:CR=1 FL=1|uniref:HTH-type transcriptional repressor n=1 Tax=Corynebacterium otitidis ATCC 51513 TaxID=883169 RepID=I7L9M8_9CORY|nr:GntR family transcriptional regulator [Corynebacterium otitidis]EJZ81636.1 hypothetical protein HMPREF9719_01457 [Corynebacterium otitidis ATCC 51513]KKO83529.1 GntR family transcriptional regulator [Corynebacterium otitidis]CCI83902.1 HTH-type transcriptional repressor [Corynebacterium otitidis ATCC 51513]
MEDPATGIELPAHHIVDGTRPKHAQLRELLDELCETSLKPGDLLPSERSLERAYGVSRVTVRRAIGDLVAAGRLQRVRGKGTFVAANPLVSRINLASFSDEMDALDVEATSDVLTAKRHRPPHEVSDWFGTDTEVHHLHLTRLRRGDGSPYVIDDAWYNDRFVPDLLDFDVTQSVYGILAEHYGMPITEAIQTIKAVAAEPEAARLLDVEVGSPLLEVTRQSQAGGRRVEHCVSLYRTDRYRMQSRVSRAR